MLPGSGKEEKRGSKLAKCPKGVLRLQFSEAEKTRRVWLHPFLACPGLHREPLIIIILLYPSEEESLRQKGQLILRAQCLPCRGFCLRLHFADECPLSGDSGPTQLPPGIAVKLAFWLGPKWLRDIDNSELFFSSDTPLARATA